MQSQSQKLTFDYLWDDARYESMQFIKENIATALAFRMTPDLWNYALSLIKPEGLVLEFGVAYGNSITHFGNLLASQGDTRTVYGFDSFVGLAEDWVGHFRPKGSYTNQGVLPPVPKNVELIKGWIEDTVPDFLTEQDQKISFLHIDTDTYSPCVFALEETYKYWQEGTVILFDELIGYPGWRHGELKALTEFQEKHPTFTFEYVGFGNEQAAIIVRSL